MSIVVKPHHRRRGIGRALLCALEAQLTGATLVAGAPEGAIKSDLECLFDSAGYSNAIEVARCYELRVSPRSDDPRYSRCLSLTGSRRCSTRWPTPPQRKAGRSYRDVAFRLARNRGTERFRYALCPLYDTLSGGRRSASVGLTRLRGWLGTVMRNLAISRWRREGSLRSREKSAARREGIVSILSTGKCRSSMTTISSDVAPDQFGDDPP